MDARGVVLDASVLVADAVTSEGAHQEAASLLVALFAQGLWLYLPTIALPEVGAAIARGVGDPEMALESTALYTALPAVRLVPVSARLAEMATEVAARQRIRGCDAVYVSLAQRLGVPLVTLDREQRERCPSGVLVYTPGTAMDALATL